LNVILGFTNIIEWYLKYSNCLEISFSKQILKQEKSLQMSCTSTRLLILGVMYIQWQLSQRLPINAWDFKHLQMLVLCYHFILFLLLLLWLPSPNIHITIRVFLKFRGPPGLPWHLWALPPGAHGPDWIYFTDMIWYKSMYMYLYVLICTYMVDVLCDCSYLLNMDWYKTFFRRLWKEDYHILMCCMI
jgi:hypothetical protein